MMTITYYFHKYSYKGAA